GMAGGRQWRACVLDDGAVPAPGQACVMYVGSRVMGGGFIRRSESEGKVAS
ncbi:aminomethyltransferase beta-barrel domain-containing protein, partial [Komagataeibacter kakiaceti]|uniref:aminomethyltransferase beta-barrel domain-containing protein n=1 Tax=Komagataeibacter kakiaceti TaxID=943261 RepID=UPI002ADE420B